MHGNSTSIYYFYRVRLRVHVVDACRYLRMYVCMYGRGSCAKSVSHECSFYDPHVCTFVCSEFLPPYTKPGTSIHKIIWISRELYVLFQCNVSVCVQTRIIELVARSFLTLSRNGVPTCSFGKVGSQLLGVGYLRVMHGVRVIYGRCSENTVNWETMPAVYIIAAC